MQGFYAQFKYPTGIMGWFVGAIMALENRERNAWAVSMLNLQSSDSILEIGFGPGVALQQAAKIARFVAGVDHSAVMVQQAKQRNKAAIQSGRVEVQRSTAQQIPYPSERFDKVFSVNSLHLWPDHAAGLADIRRVLKPGGILTIFEQPFRGDVEEAGIKTVQWLTEAGFNQVKSIEKVMKPTPTVCVRGVK